MDEVCGGGGLRDPLLVELGLSWWRVKLCCWRKRVLVIQEKN